MISQLLPDKPTLKLVLPWVIAYLALNLPYYQDGDINAFSRYAAMRSMSMEGTFNIDNLKGWSMDWSQAPNGHYYSNKAPGPALIAFPVFWSIDRIKLLTSPGFSSKYSDEKTIGYEHKIGLPLLFQMLPFCLLVLLTSKYLKERSASDTAIILTVIALLFGNTASLFHTTWFGHGMVACLVLSMFFSVHYKNYLLFGLFTGFGILSDYSVTFFLIPTVIYLFYSNQLDKQSVIKVLLGAALPAVLWIWYHTANFGHPFALPNMFQNPKFGASLENQFQLPNLKYMRFLLVGDERGILYTQPWVLLILIVMVYRIRTMLITTHPLFWVTVLGFISLWLMNAAFVGWHGGSTPGPRYLSAAFPLFAVLMGANYDRLSPWERYLAWIFVLISAVFGGLVYATTILVHEYYTIWTWLLDYLIKGPGSVNRLIIFNLTLAGLMIYTLFFRLKISLKR